MVYNHRISIFSYKAIFFLVSTPSLFLWCICGKEVCALR
uniref:Uncharacterized protein n=1 Tax=Anguilla anguilla TaxID=7936 RepID=A0A0E9VXG3_ANGAN